MSSIRLLASKPTESGMLTPCSKDDPEATQFSIYYPGMPFSSATLDLNVSAFKAEDIQRVLERVFEAGKRAAKLEFQQWLRT